MDPNRASTAELIAGASGLLLFVFMFLLVTVLGFVPVVAYLIYLLRRAKAHAAA